MRSSPRRAAVVLSLLTASALVLLVGCAPAVEPEAETSPTPAPSATSTPVHPRAAFDGQCEDVASEQRVSDALGESMNTWEPQWLDGVDRALGGVECAWSSDAYYSALARLSVYPLDVLDDEYIESEAANGCDADTSTCTASAAFDDVWVTLRVQSESAETRREGMAALIEDVGARAATQPKPVADSRAGWWTPVPTCDRVQKGLEDAAITAVAADVQADDPPMFAGGPFEHSCRLVITIEGSPYETMVHLRSGGGGAVGSAISMIPDARLEFDGREFAMAGEQYPIDGATGVLLGAVGPNLVELDRLDFSTGKEEDAPVLAAIVSALS